MKINHSEKTYRLLRIGLLIYLLAPISCVDNKFNCTDSCCGETFEQNYTAIDSLTLTVGSIEFYPGDEYERREFTTNPSVNWDTAAMSLDVFELINLSSIRTEEEFKVNFSFINSAYACSPPPPEPIQKIESIIITSNQDVVIDDLTYASGVDLSALYSIVSRYTSEENHSIEDFIIKQNENPYIFGSYGTSIVLKLNQYVKMTEQTLTIQIKCDDLSVFELSTRDFKIE